MRTGVLALVCGVALINTGPAAQETAPQAAFRSTTELVLVDVLVTRGTTPVPGLRAEDFDVRDSGQRQKIELVSVESMPVDLLLALDVSASLTGPQLAGLKQAAKAAVAALRPLDRAALLTFSNDIKSAADWTNDGNRLNQSIDRLEASGWTSLFDATFTALNIPDSPTRRPLLLVFTDGHDTSSWLTAPDVLAMAERSRLIIYGVSAGVSASRSFTATTVAGSIGAPAVDRSGELGRIHPTRIRERLLSDPFGFRSLFLRVIANDTGGELLEAAPGTDLRGVFLQVLERFSQRYLLSYVPTGVPRPGWHPIEVRLKDDSLKVIARRGYSR